MSSNLVVVAIPKEDDYVWKLSSEKVPHMTILFLGDAVGNPNVAKISSFVEHAVNTTLHRFGLSVDRRGTLGPDQADVLFFDKRWAKELETFRFQLLQDPNIRTAYDSVPQFDGGWNPHLTMGYPETPAKEDPREYPGISYVQFEKIAVWFGDYQGIEFELPDYNWEETAVGWSETAAAGQAAVEELKHHGVKGMKWGVRRSSSSAPAHADSVKAHDARQKLKSEGIHSLSNDEIRALTQRIDLEKNVKSKASPAATAKQGHDAVKAILAVVGTVNAAILLSQSPAGKAIKEGLLKK